MAGNRLGGRKAAKTNIERYGKDFYAEIGRKGGMNGFKGGFYGDEKRARKYGALGGAKSKRGHKFIKEEDGYRFYRHIESNKIVKYPIKEVGDDKKGFGNRIGKLLFQR